MGILDLAILMATLAAQPTAAAVPAPAAESPVFATLLLHLVR